MQKRNAFFLVIFFLSSIFFLANANVLQEKQQNMPQNPSLQENRGRLAVEKTEIYLPLLKGKKVGVVANHASVFVLREKGKGSFEKVYQGEKVYFVHLIDSLVSLNLNVTRLFSPEHGLRGEAEAGAKVESGRDSKTGIELISLYGSHKKPTKQDMKGIDIMLFDLQDVGVRFYTYISTLHYVMESCAENGIPLIVIDRPNPHIGAIDGPVLDTAYRSFVGMHPVPVLYGLTIGEYALMINQQSWLSNKIKCNLTVVPLSGYTRNTIYSLPIPPSPNLQSDKAICAYPSLCFFEGTNISLGRGTDDPFTVYGFPGSEVGDYVFTPKSIAGKSQNPPYMNKQCRGFEVSCMYDQSYKSYVQVQDSVNICSPMYLNLKPILLMYKVFLDKKKFFIPFFRTLAGTDKLEEQIKQGLNEMQIREGWQEELEEYKKMSSKYHLYSF